MSQVKSLADENESLKKKLAELQENLKGYEKDYDDIVNENDSLRAKVQAFQAEDEKELLEDDEEDSKSSEDEEIEAEEEEEEEEKKVTEEEKKEYSDKDEEVEAEEEESDETQAIQIAKALRSLGVEPVATKPKSRILSKDEILQKFASISDPKERATFYANNRKVIFN